MGHFQICFTMDNAAMDVRIRVSGGIRDSIPLGLKKKLLCCEVYIDVTV